jgi:hypothetical protein
MPPFYYGILLRYLVRAVILAERVGEGLAFSLKGWARVLRSGTYYLVRAVNLAERVGEGVGIPFGYLVYFRLKIREF